jgi:hypothetical protein
LRHAASALRFKETIMAYLLLFLAGALLINALPHLVSGVQGQSFPTPFAKPRGVGNSSPLTNFLWGFANLATGSGIVLRWWDAVDHKPGAAALAAGGLAIGLFLAMHFGKVRGAK